MRISVLFTAILLAGAAAAGDNKVAIQPMPSGFSSLANAKIIEVKDAAGQVVLLGTFAKEDTDGDESEMEAALKSANSASDAKGKAEIELKIDDGVVEEQELEIDLDDLPASASYKILIDGNDVGTVTSSEDGDVDIKFTTKQD
jgi:hypothetical protein